jgi:hypothetical protein
MTDAYKELRENRAAMAQLFSSKGWEILVAWTAAQTKGYFETAIRGETEEARNEARIQGLTMEKFVRLAMYLADEAGLNNAEEAPSQSEAATSEAP